MLHVVEHEPLAKYTSWRIGGPARYLANARSAEELREAAAWARERDLPLFLLGGGTNLLIPDSGFDGLVLRYRNHDLRIDAEAGRVWLAAGAPMAGSVRRLAGLGWGGLEWAEGLPGTIGGAVFGNAGCYGSDVAASLARAWLLIDGADQEWAPERLGYGYRTSALKQARSAQPPPPLTIVTGAEFRIVRADPAELAERMRQTAAERKRKTPVGSSCGSVFKNPAGRSAGQLIEAAGLKGARIGAAEVSQKHANYIVNLGGASSDDILRLVEHIQTQVLRAHGVELELEIQIVR